MGLARLFTRPPVQHRGAGAGFEVQLQNWIDTWGESPWSGAYGGYLSVPGAWRASVMISDLFAQMPFHSYRRADGPGLIRTPRNAAILEAPAGTIEDPTVTFASWGMDYLWEGNAVGVFAAFSEGLPTAVLPVPACRAMVRRVDGRREYAIQTVDGHTEIFDEAQVFHVKGPCEPGALRGLGVLETQTRSLRLARDLEKQAGQISQHGVPTGVLKASNPEATKDNLAAAKEAWLESQRRRTIAALGPHIDFEPLSWNPEEMELVEARKFSLTQLELMFGLPVGWLGGQTSSRTYSNIEQDAVNLVKFSTLAGMITKFESVFTRRCLPRGQWAKANRDAVLRGDTMTRYQAHAIALGRRPWKTVNEVRRTEDLDPVDGGDVIAPEPATAGDPQEGGQQQ